MTKFDLIDLSNIIGISLSEKSYKVVGLKCNPEELPESLYFMLSDNVYFKIPYIGNQNTIVQHSLEKNISLVAKVLSYFELEEVQKEELQVTSYVKLEKIINNSNHYKIIQAKKSVWFRGIVKKIEQMFKSGRYSKDMGYFSNKITNGDVEKYLEFRKNISSYDQLIEKFIDGKIEIGKKSKKQKPEDSFPNSFKKLFIEIVDSYDYICDYCDDYIKFIMKSDQNVSSSNATKILENLLLFKEKDNNEETTLDYSIKFQENENTNYSTIYDALNDQFSAGFKYTNENIDALNEVASIFRETDCSSYETNLDRNTNLSQDSAKNEIAIELFKNIELLNLKNYDASKSGDCTAIYHIYDLLLYCLYSHLDISSKTISYAFGINRISTFVFLKDPEINEKTIAIKYQDMINLKWSEELTRTVQFSVKDLKESIRHRYFLTSVCRTNYLDQRNMVVDTMLPQSFIGSDMNLEKTNRVFQSSLNLNTKTAYAISPLTASAYGCKQIPIEHLCRILGFTKENIKSMMNNVKSKEYHFVFVGAGGTGNNTAIWLSRMLEMINLPFLFKNVYVFEKEDAEIHNMLRFPKDPYSITLDSGIFNSSENYSSKNKCNIIAKELRSLSANTPICVKKYIATDNSSSSYPSVIFSTKSITEEVKDENGNIVDFRTVSKILPNGNTVFYGAPDINTRQNLSNVGNFISATHASNSCNIYINPEQDAMIQVESYGMIQLAPFFMNQLRMAIGLLEILSADNSIELLAKKDHEFLSYQFNGESVLKNDRVYNFKIIEDLEMATENQATEALQF